VSRELLQFNEQVVAAAVLLVRVVAAGGRPMVQVVWQFAAPELLQFNKQLLLLLRLPVIGGCVLGITQAVWQFAAWELHDIMQFVVVELCASRILPAANAPVAPALIAVATRSTAKPRMTILRGSNGAMITRSPGGRNMEAWQKRTDTPLRFANRESPDLDGACRCKSPKRS
jgi:hypothetical protein